MRGQDKAHLVVASGRRGEAGVLDDLDVDEVDHQGGAHRGEGEHEPDGAPADARSLADEPAAGGRCRRSPLPSASGAWTAWRRPISAWRGRAPRSANPEGDRRLIARRCPRSRR